VVIKVEIKFKFSGHSFDLHIDDRILLTVDGDPQRDIEVIVSGSPKKSGWPETIQSAKANLRRCLDCGRSKKSDLKQQYEIISTFEDAYERELSGKCRHATPQLPGR